MAFQTGVYTSPANLLASLATFVATVGWTVHTTTGDGTGGTGGYGNVQLSISSDGIVINLLPTNALGGSLLGQPALTWIGTGTPYYAHTGSPNASGTLNTVAMMNGIGTGVGTGYSFYANNSSPRYVHVVAESSAGVYAHMSFGTLDKAGTFTGGGYLSGSSVGAGTTSIRSPFGGKGSRVTTATGTNWIYVPGLIGESGGWNQNFGGLGYQNNNGVCANDGLWYPGIDPTTQRTPLAPIICFSWDVPTSTAINRSHILGRVQDARSLSMRNRDPASTLIIGSDTWRVFPWRTKLDVGGDANTIYGFSSSVPQNSGLNGIAYLEFA